MYRNKLENHGPRDGFAIIIALSLMAFVLLLLLSISTLVRVEIVTSSQAKNLQEARANAQLGLMLALGELQKYAGPDQRVTATAEILDSNPLTEEIDDVENAHWVGVWRTDGFKAEAQDTDFIQYTEGPMTDRRASGYDKAAETQAWLVSGENPDPTLPPASDSINIFGSSTSTLPAADRVYVSKVKIDENDGHYAYWVSDDGVKAKVNLQKSNQATPPNSTKPETYHQVLSPDSFDLEHLFSNFNNVPGDDLDKLNTKAQLVLPDFGTPSVGTDLAEATQLLSHDLTLSSFSVLSDTLNGGLKRNLTAFIHSSDGNVPGLGDFPALTDNTSILTGATERDVIGPKFGAIREWYLLGDEITGNLENRAIQMTFPNLASGPEVDPTLPGSDRIVDIANFTKQAIQPVLMDASYQTNYSYDPDTRELYELTYPRVVLWNPYNVKLTTPKMYVLFDFCSQDSVRFYYDKTETDGTTTNTYITMNEDYWFNNGRAKRFAFCIPETTFEAGETLHFSTAGTGAPMLFSKARQISETTIDDNLLSATTDPADLYCFYRVTGTLEPTADLTTLELIYKRNPSDTVNYPLMYNGDKPTQSIYLYAANNTNADPIRSDLGGDDFPAVQKYFLDNYSRGNNGRWGPEYNPPEAPGQHLAIGALLSSGTPPDSLSGYGMRWKHFYESYSNRVYGLALKEPWYVSPIIYHNVRARQIHRWPNDNIFGMEYTGAGTGTGAEGTSGTRAHLYSYGPLGQTRQFPEWNDVVNSLTLTDGKYRTGPFFDTVDANAITVYPLFDIPDPDIGIHSIGALQHVQFSPQIWHPSYVIGNGFASPYVSPETTGLTKAEEVDLWTQKVSRLYLGNNDEVHRLHEAGDNPFVYDISYETNHHIWDNYFLSSLPHDTSAPGWTGDEWDIKQALPNSRMQIRPETDNASKYENLTDFYKAAKYLMVSGGFNINSTRQDAWEALFRSFNQVPLPARDGTSLASQFSRFLVPEKKSAAASSATDDELWNGYRNLSEQEISDLAEKVVIQVKKRAPFISIGDFVNRRLGLPNGTDDEQYFFGALQAAINQSGVNNDVNNGLDSKDPNHSSDDFNLPNAEEAVNDYDYSERWDSVGVPLAQEYKTFEYKSEDGTETFRLSEAMGAPGYLSQADILQKVGSVITARSDTFTIRTYGDVVNATNDDVVARAWCEAVVQRTPDPITPDPDINNLNPIKGASGNFGRRFIIVDFRWLAEDEI